MIDRKLIEQIVLQVIHSLNKPPLFVLNAPDDAVAMEQLEARWHVTKIAAATLDVPDGVRDAAFLEVTQDVFVKAALGMADTHESKILSRLIRQGVRIYLVPAKEFEWILDIDQKEVPNSEYAKLFIGYKKNLERFGVRVVSWKSLVTTNLDKDDGQIPRSGTVHGKLLTEKDVRACAEDEIFVGKTTIVTPLARDAARELGKRICIVGEKDWQREGEERSCKSAR